MTITIILGIIATILGIAGIAALIFLGIIIYVISGEQLPPPPGFGK